MGNMLLTVMVMLAAAESVPDAYEIDHCAKHCSAPQQAAMARHLFHLGQIAQRDGQWTAARKAYQGCTQLAPEWGLAFLHLGIVSAELYPDATEALGALQRAIALNRNNPRAFYYLGMVLLRQADLAGAKEAFEQTLRLRENLLDARFQLGVVCERLDDHEAAIQAYRGVVEFDRTHTGALAALARLYEASERFEEAERALRSITALQPHVAYHYYRLGEFYSRTGQPQLAEQSYAEAEILDPRPQREMRRLR